MLHEIDKDLIDIETKLSAVERQFPAIARDAAQARFALEIARAESKDQIVHTAIAKGDKKPTDMMIDALTDLATKDELEASRMATAELEVARVTLSSLQSRLSSIQTRSRMMNLEMGLAR